MDGKWDVNNDLSVTLSVLGTDNALKHINRSMKVTDCLVGTRGGDSAFESGRDARRLA